MKIVADVQDIAVVVLVNHSLLQYHRCRPRVLDTVLVCGRFSVSPSWAALGTFLQAYWLNSSAGAFAKSGASARNSPEIL